MVFSLSFEEVMKVGDLVYVRDFKDCFIIVSVDNISDRRLWYEVLNTKTGLSIVVLRRQMELISETR